MTKKSIIGLIVLVLLATIVVADNFDEAFAILKSNIPCNQLTDDQLEMRLWMNVWAEKARNS